MRLRPWLFPRSIWGAYSAPQTHGLGLMTGRFAVHLNPLPFREILATDLIYGPVDVVM